MKNLRTKGNLMINHEIHVGSITKTDRESVALGNFSGSGLLGELVNTVKEIEEASCDAGYNDNHEEAFPGITRLERARLRFKGAVEVTIKSVKTASVVCL